MSRRSLSQLSDPALLQLFATLLTRDRVTTADLIGVMAEIDDRKLYVPAGYESMHAFCEGAYGMSEDEADNRIRTARLARRYPAILGSLADGRLNLTAVLLLSRRLTPENAEELLAGAAHKTKREVLEWLECRFPSTAVLPWVEDLGGDKVSSVPERMTEGPVPERIPETLSSAPEAARARVSVSGAIQFNLSPRGQERLRHVQDLLGHQGAHNVGEIFERALEAYAAQLEKRKFGAGTRRRGNRRGSANPRYIPADMRWAVYERDGGQCTFKSDDGHRCEARAGLELDHILPVAHAGESTVDNLRLRCRAHNQFEAERTSGAEFMRHKRVAAAEARASKKRTDPAPPHVEEVIPWLRQLRYKERDAREAAALCVNMPNASLEDRVRAALKFFRVRGTRLLPAGPPGSVDYAAGGSVVNGG